MKRILASSFLSLFTLLLFITLPSPAFSQPALKVGALIPFSGRWGDSGRECARGMLDAEKWINQRGGIFGKKLEISLIEDTSQVAETIAAYRKLNESDNVLLLYIYSTETGLSLLPHIQFNRIPALVSTFPSHLANPLKYPYVFSITPTPLDLSKIAMKFISERSGIKWKKPKILFLGSPDFLGQHFLEEAKEYGRSLGLEIGPDITFDDLSAEKTPSPLAAVAAYNPDFAYMSLTPRQASQLFQEAKKMDLKTKWICSMRTFDEHLSPFDGVLGVQPVSPFGEDIPGMASVKESHQKWHPYDSHTLSYTEGWVTVQVIAEALGRSLPEQGFSRERVKSALETFRNFVVGGLVPPITITPEDHRPSVESRVFIIREGKILRHTEFLSLKREKKKTNHKGSQN